MKDKQLEALIRKTTGKASSDKARRARFIDPTLVATRGEEDSAKTDSEKLFKEMKRREF
jgi:hypothetical protein